MLSSKIGSNYEAWLLTALLNNNRKIIKRRLFTQLNLNIHSHCIDQDNVINYKTLTGNTLWIQYDTHGEW